MQIDIYKPVNNGAIVLTVLALSRKKGIEPHIHISN